MCLCKYVTDSGVEHAQEDVESSTLTADQHPRFHPACTHSHRPPLPLLLSSLAFSCLRSGTRTQTQTQTLTYRTTQIFPKAMAKSVESFTELVQKVTGKPDYKFGDLSKGSMERISTTIVSIEEGSIDAMDAIVAKTSSPDYVFGDLTKAAALEVCVCARARMSACGWKMAGVRAAAYLKRGFWMLKINMGWLRPVGSIKYRSLLQNIFSLLGLFCKRDL